MKIQKDNLEKEYNAQKDIWKLKTDLIKEIKKLECDKAQEKLYEQKCQELQKLTDEKPIVHENVNTEVIADILSNATGIPIPTPGTVKGDISTLMNLDKVMEERVIGQDHAVKKIIQNIKIARANIADPRKPIGVFMLVGASGVGKNRNGIRNSRRYVRSR